MKDLLLIEMFGADELRMDRAVTPPLPFDDPLFFSESTGAAKAYCARLENEAFIEEVLGPVGKLTQGLFDLAQPVSTLTYKQQDPEIAVEMEGENKDRATRCTCRCDACTKGKCSDCSAKERCLFSSQQGQKHERGLQPLIDRTKKSLRPYAPPLSDAAWDSLFRPLHHAMVQYVCRAVAAHW